MTWASPPPATTHRAVEPAPSQFLFPRDAAEIAGVAGGGDVVGVGADLQPGTVLAAYRSGLFPMPARRGLMAWWSPDPRGILPLDGLRVSRSLRRSLSRYEVRVDTALDEVIDGCAGGRRDGAWIDRDIKRAYRRLFEWGWVHSVEAWDADGRLAGGLYGVAIGGLFAGESMFHRQTDASKVALVGLVSRLRNAGGDAGAGGGGAAGGGGGDDGGGGDESPPARLLDVQWATPHLQTLGAVEVSRERYLDLLAAALPLPQPAVFGGAS